MHQDHSAAPGRRGVSSPVDTAHAHPEPTPHSAPLPARHSTLRRGWGLSRGCGLTVPFRPRAATTSVPVPQKAQHTTHCTPRHRPVRARGWQPRAWGGAGGGTPRLPSQPLGGAPSTHTHPTRLGPHTRVKTHTRHAHMLSQFNTASPHSTTARVTAVNDPTCPTVTFCSRRRLLLRPLFRNSRLLRGPVFLQVLALHRMPSERAAAQPTK